MLSAALLLTTLITLLYFFGVRIKKYKALDVLPGPSLWEILKYTTYRRSDIHTYLENLNSVYGPVAKIWVKPFNPMLVVAHPEYVEKVLQSKHHISKPDSIKVVQPIAGDGLFTNLDDDLWRHERKLFGHACTQQAIRKDMHVYKNHYIKLEKSIYAKLSSELDVHPLIEKFMMDVLFDLMMNQQSNMQENPETAKFIKCVTDCLDIVLHKTKSVISGNDFLFKFSSQYKAWKQGLHDLHSFLEGVANEVLCKRDKLKGVDDREFLKRLFDSGIERSRLKYHIFTFIAGGHETTSNTISFALFEIARSPTIQKKIVEESLTILENDKHADLNFDDVHNLVYTECVIKETLRMYPAISLIPRLIKTPVTIGGTEIPAGTTITFSVNGLHKNEKYFPNPNIFNPNRFMDQIPPNVYIPFSAGARNCIGDRIAMSVMKYTISKLVRNFELLPVPGAEIRTVNRIVVHSTTGAVVKIKKRHI